MVIDNSYRKKTYNVELLKIGTFVFRKKGRQTWFCFSVARD